MKKLLAIALMSTLTINIASAGALSSAVKSTANAVKNDVKSTAIDVKNATKADVANKVNSAVNGKTSKAAEKKAEKLKKINDKLTAANKEMAKVKADKNITETERILKMKRIQTQIDVYTKQKAALQ